MREKIELFHEIDKHLMEDAIPSKFMNKASNDPMFLEYPFVLLIDLKGANQSPKHHPEGNVWNHTMLVLDQAAIVKNKSKNPNVFMWAALLHDIGKPGTTKVKKGRITSYDHERLGAELTRKFLSEFSFNQDTISSITALVRWHMQILFVVNDLPFADIKSMKEEVDINEVALLGWCDRMGRGIADSKKEEKNIKIFLNKCSN